ncbi:MAG: hypothetical protein NC399_10870 [Muribaculum sp.]|nr:hypothetical protein [Muribaculum sp.]
MGSAAVVLGIFWGTMIFMLLLTGIFYVFYGISHAKALKALGYDRPWMAWIPFAQYWAFAEVALDGKESINLFDSFDVPATLFKLWWLIVYCVSFVPGVGAVLSIAVRVICLGTCYIKVYARLDGKTEAETQALGYVSGFFPIIAAFKFLMGHYDV